MTIENLSPFILFVLALSASAIGAYVGAYLREKGRNLATREDVDRIVQRTEAIKAEISDTVWRRQRRWVLQHEIYSSLLENLNELRASMETYPTTTDPALHVRRLVDSIEGVRRARALGTALLRREALEILDRLDLEWREVRDLQGTALDHFAARKDVVKHTYDAIIAAAREDLLGEEPRA